MARAGAPALHTDAELLLKSRRVVPDRLQEAGFAFEHPDWPGAAADLVRRLHEHRSPTVADALHRVPAARRYG